MKDYYITNYISMYSTHCLIILDMTTLCFISVDRISFTSVGHFYRSMGKAQGVKKVKNH